MVRVSTDKDAPLERDIQKACKRKLLAAGATKVVKLTTWGMYGEKGWPDLMVLAPPRFTMFIEVKRPGEGCTELQAKRQRELLADGFPVHVVDNAADAVWIFQEEWMIWRRRMRGLA